MPDPAKSASYLFLCTGNHYRSRLAEALTNWYAKERGLDLTAASAGFQPMSARHAPSPIVFQYLDAVGLPREIAHGEAPRLVSAEMMLESDLVVLLNEPEHVPFLDTRYAWVAKRLRAEERLRAWHVGDAPPREGILGRMAKLTKPPVTQSPASATEHIHFGVLALLAEVNS